MMRSYRPLLSAISRRYYTTGAVQHKVGSLDIGTLRKQYEERKITPTELVKEVEERLEANKGDNAFITRLPPDHIKAQAALLEQQFNKNPLETLSSKPLFGIPFSVKDNIDVAGYPTTVACPDYSFTPWKTAPVVQRLLDAGGILIGKNNMDQFATGLVGIRSPYGTPRNCFDPRYCPGGSSSGSGTAVSSGQVSFSIGTDTAGSGRIPAAFQNIVGLKPSRGLLSTSGLTPACRSLDCLSVFGLTATDAYKVFSIAKGFDPEDEYSRREEEGAFRRKKRTKGDKLRLGYPGGKGLAFFGDTNGQAELYHEGRKRLGDLIGAEHVEIDYLPFTEVARVLYEGPWVAERLSAIETFVKKYPNSLHPTTRAIIPKGEQFSAVDTFKSMRKLEAMRQAIAPLWENIDVLIVPTASIYPTIQEAELVPIGVNTVLGYYTNFVNLLDLCGIAIPNGFLPNGLPAGITLLAPAFHDEQLYKIAKQYQQKLNLTLGATGYPLPKEDITAEDKNYWPVETSALSGKTVNIAVLGAHLKGQPLNHQLTSIDAKLVKTTKTARNYRMFALKKDEVNPPRPGLIQVAEGDAKSGPQEVEVWAVPTEYVGSFLNDNVKAPLAIGNVKLEDGSVVKGFVCENFATSGCTEITELGGWRKYLSTLTK